MEPGPELVGAPLSNDDRERPKSLWTNKSTCIINPAIIGIGKFGSTK
ncbi:hypothetical protein BFJ63_vAg11711 [Fusarium oxysporum f. sp. narcissi]|nr:hypothetical protein BFJ65_g9391 [Fusarium oxysporum f. sp. cepae]RKL10949.1 hypothetical protein BFJ71_g396 [Fusarium oxysporum]RYC85381.1 hypothetical protein BFJ63_vAg11711 [Fusarium oxysporum f. sp. narcissi]RKK41808.1 hypothetical protein BFJ67_g10383 [Fusarium oxysporum f. sp. cepae]RKK62907.1 hypothetical protein BFJ66_g692 [Fusarium oxysporum f. sp. cepae]